MGLSDCYSSELARLPRTGEDPERLFGTEPLYDNAAEAERLRVLRATDLLDTEPERIYDEITELAAQICDAPVSMISLVDEARQWFKSVRGIPCRETPREGSMCTYTIEHNGPLIVPDLLDDSRFAASPLVSAREPGFRFYAGVPIRNEDGHALGSLCVVDFIPRNLTDAQVRALCTLAHQVEMQITLREKIDHLERANQKNQQLAEALADSESRFRLFMDRTPAATFIKDAEGRMLYYNRSLAQLYGASSDEWIGKTDHEIWPADLADSYRSADLIVLDHNQEVEIEERTQQPGTQPVYWKTFKFPLTNARGERCIGGIAMNVTTEKLYQEQLRTANLRLEALTLIDPLTGLGNRRALDLTLQQSLQPTVDKEVLLGLLVVDVDHFKRLNDTFGHASGDDALRHIGEVLRRIIRRVDHVCRFGGEEFVVVLPGADGAQVRIVAERIRSEIERLQLSSGTVTVSIGGALWNTSLITPSDLLSLADSALYAAKRAGRNRFLLAAA